MPLITETITFGRIPHTGVVVIEYEEGMPTENPEEYHKLKLQAETKARELNISNRAKIEVMKAIEKEIKRATHSAKNTMRVKAKNIGTSIGKNAALMNVSLVGNFLQCLDDIPEGCAIISSKEVKHSAPVALPLPSVSSQKNVNANYPEWCAMPANDLWYDEDYLENILKPLSNLKIIDNETIELMNRLIYEKEAEHMINQGKIDFWNPTSNSYVRVMIQGKYHYMAILIWLSKCWSVV
jgi:hypothetical protein